MGVEGRGESGARVRVRVGGRKRREGEEGGGAGEAWGEGVEGGG